MTNGSGHQKKPPIPLSLLSFDREGNGRDIVLLELQHSGGSDSDYFSIPQRDFVSQATEFLQRIQPNHQDQLIAVLGEIRDKLGKLSCHCPKQDGGEG